MPLPLKNLSSKFPKVNDLFSAHDIDINITLKLPGKFLYFKLFRVNF